MTGGSDKGMTKYVGTDMNWKRRRTNSSLTDIKGTQSEVETCVHPALMQDCLCTEQSQNYVATHSVVMAVI